MALQEIEYGSICASSILNDNFEYLDDRISSYASSITTLQSNISSVNSTLNGRINTTNSNLSDLSDAVHQTINQLATSGTIALTIDSVNAITPSQSVTFTLPTVTDNTIFHQILVQLNLTTVYTINVGTTHYFNGKAPDLSTTGNYDLIYEYDKANNYWVCGWMRKS